MTSTVWATRVVERYGHTSAEIRQLPQGWRINNIQEHPFQIYFINVKGGGSVWEHPTLGPLPDPWLFCLMRNENGEDEPQYYNTLTKEVIREDPRYHPDTLKARRNSNTATTQETRIASSIVKNSPGLMSKLKRAPVSNSISLRDHYEIVHAIDDGEGGLGAMNGGVYVVRVKGFPQLYVEKRFKPEKYLWSYTTREVELLRRCRHGSLTMYCAAFLDHSTFMGSVYVEFCDRGSLEDLIKTYIEQRSSGIDVSVPELFIWHAFLGLVDGLAYLQGGRSYLNDAPNSKPKAEKGWVPLLHRDVKPDNVLLRSRSTLGSQKYFYCILSDFGLCCEDNGKDEDQKDRSVVGTPHYWAPELTWDPYPDEELRKRLFSSHTSKSDVWAIGAIMYNMAHPDLDESWARNYGAATGAHIDMSKKPQGLEAHVWASGRGSRREIIVNGSYSKALKDAMQVACRKSPSSRPDAMNLVERIRAFMHDGKIEATGPQRESDRLPPWATRHHDYHVNGKVKKSPKKPRS